jgi:mono/diheme cytochrome c family protein
MKLVALLIVGFSTCAFLVSAHSQTASEPPPSPEQVAKGSELFAQICSHCHGPRMVNPGNASFDLRKFPHDDQARFFNSVRNGKKAMPPWKDVLHQDEIEDVWAYVRTSGTPPE